jgi:lysophospholipase L1-like esterase
MGDSISTEGPNAVLSSCSMWSMLKEKLSSDNLGKSITFLNRSVGGQTWLNANTKPTVYPYWYTDTNRTWLDTVQQEQPDLLFLAFGMNDANGFNSSAVVAVINKIKQWDKIPDIIFITNPTPAQTTIYPDGSGFGFTGQIFQEGRDYAAGWVRDYAKFSGFQCIDINRSMTAMRDGYDVCSGVMRFSRKISASHYVAQEACLDFGVSGVVNPSLWPIGKVLAIKSGLGDNDKVFVIRTQTGIKVEGFTSGLSTYFSKDLVYNWEGQEFILEVSVLGGRCYVHTVTNKNKMLVIDFGVVRHGGIFLPVISWQDESDSGPFSEITLFTGYGTPSYKQTITDSEIWGPSDSTADTKFPLGGNGINHFSSQGLEYVVRPTIECCNFSVGGDESGLHAGGLWVKKSNGESLYSKTVTFQTDITTAAGALFFEREPHIDVDFPRIFMDKGGSKLSFETSFHVLTTGGVLCWVVSSGDTTLNNAIRYRLCSNEVRNDVLVTIQITMRGRWK